MKKLMMVAAVAAAGGAVAAGLGPQNYVQDGLMTHFDAIDNEGTGTHNRRPPRGGTSRARRTSPC